MRRLEIAWDEFAVSPTLYVKLVSENPIRDRQLHDALAMHFLQARWDGPRRAYAMPPVPLDTIIRWGIAADYSREQIQLNGVPLPMWERASLGGVPPPYHESSGQWERAKHGQTHSWETDPLADFLREKYNQRELPPEYSPPFPPNMPRMGRPSKPKPSPDVCTAFAFFHLLTTAPEWVCEAMYTASIKRYHPDTNKNANAHKATVTINKHITVLRKYFQESTKPNA